MGPEDQHPWDREDEEIRQAFAEKDAEIEGLKARVEALRQIRDEDKALITELCDELEIHSSTYPGAPIEKLIHRAREATR